MYCDNCGCELGENIKKCPVCGKEFPMINPVQEEEEGTTVLTSTQQEQVNPQMQQMPGTGASKAIPDDSDVMIRKKGEKKGMSKGTKAALIVIPIVVVIAIAVLSIIYVPKFRKYNEAEDLMTQGKVEEAVTIYKDLGKFKDSYSKGNGEAYYRYAADLEKEGRNLEAAEYYKKSGNSMKAAEDLGDS